MLQVPNGCLPTVFARLSKRYHLLPSNEDTLAKLNLNLKPQTINLREAASFSSVASQRFHDNVHVTEITESQQEGHYGTIEEKEETPLFTT